MISKMVQIDTVALATNGTHTHKVTPICIHTVLQTVMMLIVSELYSLTVSFPMPQTCDKLHPKQISLLIHQLQSCQSLSQYWATPGLYKGNYSHITPNTETLGEWRKFDYVIFGIKLSGTRQSTLPGHDNC